MYASGAAASSPQRVFVYGSYIDEPLMMKAGSTKSYYSRNQQFSITALTNSSGSVVERYAYDAHGNTIIMAPTGAMRSSSSLGNPFAFTGRFLHTELEMMYFRARYYDPSTGEFISRDPLEYVDGMSLYRGYFVPIGVDPSGLSRHHWIPQSGKTKTLLNNLCKGVFGGIGMTVKQISDAFVTPAGKLTRGGLHDCIQRRLKRGRYNNLAENAVSSAKDCCEALQNLSDLIYEAWHECTFGKTGPVQMPPLEGPFTNPKNPKDTGTFFKDLIDFACNSGCPRPKPPYPIRRPVPVPKPVDRPIPVAPPVVPPVLVPPSQPVPPARPWWPPRIPWPKLPTPVFPSIPVFPFPELYFPDDNPLTNGSVA
jgi:RHS repeat-associated protein